MAQFNQQVYKIVRKIPQSKVATYGQIATLLNSPRAARQVGWALAALTSKHKGDVPWWRVINRHGFVSIKGHSLEVKEIQKQKLSEENVEFIEEYKVNLDKHLWDM